MKFSTLFAATAIVGTLAIGWQFAPQRQTVTVDRDPFVLFPSSVGDWSAGQSVTLDKGVEQVLGADDYLSVSLLQPGTPGVDLFMAWYADQDRGGVHSPEVCLPGAGWEIAQLDAIDAPQKLVDVAGGPFTLNRAIIQKGVDRMVVYYWYEQQGTRTASMFRAKLELMMGKVKNGRDDSAIVRMITAIGPDESDAAAEARLIDATASVLGRLDRFIPAPGS